MVNIEEIQVIHNEEAGRFETEVDGYFAEAAYYRNGNKIVFTHTGVPRPIGGKGVANKLVKTALDYARENNLDVVPLCSFVAVFIRRHPEYQDLVDRS
ncbi:MAG: N-acetyltransferase [Chloroflexi bacterium]|nr:N-acetyltransferase [Chloroflexota bacterium]OJV99746.1 MAG: GNAT family N-acetyltransferase [Chloroflexi bacterium 54-19]